MRHSVIRSFGHSVIAPRRGSALLIVLGMIAFMVISAVAFSAYMRFARLPSSYLRRASSSRLLAKAALAEAIDQIDIALGNDPFPFSMGHEFSEGGTYADEGYYSPRASVNNRPARQERRNYWRNHCFIGTNGLVLANNTVSTLTLEGLAYLPPALINEARYYSRHSAGATWHNFGFDSGRYAFFAVDVSDHFDVNRVFADAARTSSDRGRITLAHVFDNPVYSSPVSAKQWDDFVGETAFGSRSKLDDIKKGVPDAYRNASGFVPFTSLADLNLAINQKGWSPNLSPFCQYILSQEDFVVSVGATETKASMSRGMAFVADSYAPSTNDSNSAQYDLCRTQPFTRVETGNAQLSVEQIIPQTTPMLQRLKDELSGLDVVMLYDYLDCNDVPASLALPSVERQPMICGLQPRFSFQVEPKAEEPKYNGGPIPTSGLTANSPSINVVHAFRMKFTKGPENKVSALLMFPFRRNEEADNGVSYPIDFAARIGFTADNGPGFRAPDNSAFVISDENGFSGSPAAVGNGVIRLYRKASGSFTPPSVVADEKEAMASSLYEASFDLSDIENWFNNNDLFSITYKYEVENQGTEENPNWQYVKRDPVPNSATVNADFHPLGATGAGDGGFNKAMVESGGAVKVRPFVTVTARLKSDRSNKYVDLVPASYLDDNAYNMIPTAAAVVSGVSGNQNNLPLMTLGDSNGNEIEWGVNAFSGSGGQKTVKVQPTSSGGALICPDPRWNFAPENFYAIDETLQTGDWFPQKCGVGEQNRDNDVFMACSNQGYLQSISELAFLPRTSDAFGGGDSMLGDCRVAFPYGDGTFKLFPGATDAFSALPHGQLMWRTYRLYAKNGLAADPLYDLGVFSSGSGPRVNPYTTSRGVMMAALANTPYSWWAASTNYTADAFGKSALKTYQYTDAKAFNEKYAFSARSTAPSEAQIDWNDLDNVAGNFVSKFRSDSYDTWEAAYQALWNTHTLKAEYRDYLCDVKLEGDTDDLYEVDRKMLYGFWRDSFAARQQLFLVFVRAEPMMMGGAGAGQTPPQLGARAVALVWRDPNPTPEDVGSQQPRPHRTRILFYRQFD